MSGARDRSPRLSGAHWRYLLVEQGFGSGVLNFVVNGGLAWLVFREVRTVPLWGGLSIAGDTVGTCLVLPLMTCLIVTPMARRRVLAGRLDRVDVRSDSRLVPAWLPANALIRGLVVGLLCTVVLAPLTIGLLALLAVTPMEQTTFILFKASFAAAAALLLTPLISLWAIAGRPLAASPRPVGPSELALTDAGRPSPS